MSLWVKTRLPSKNSRRSSKQSLNAGCSFAISSLPFLGFWVCLASRSGDEPARSLCSREMCGGGRTSRTSFGGQKVEAILHRDPLRLREKGVLASCLNAKEGTCPGSGYRICTDTAGVKVLCATVTQSRRVAGLPRQTRKIMNTKAKRIVVACLSRLSTLSLGGCPSFRAVS